MTENVLKKVHGFKCQHNKWLVDDKLAYVECGICGEKLNPMWVIGQMCYRETRANMRIAELDRTAELAANKNRCKCQHCGKMTKIQK